MLRGWPGKVLGEEDVKAPGLLPVQPPARLELPCREELCRDGERRKVSPTSALVAAVPGFVRAAQGRGWSLGWSQRLLLASGISRITSEGKRGLIFPSSSSMPGSLPAWRNCNPSLCPYD